MNPTNKIWMHDRLLKMYQRAMQYAELLEFAGAYEKAAEVRSECELVSAHHDLDLLLREEPK